MLFKFRENFDSSIDALVEEILANVPLIIPNGWGTAVELYFLSLKTLLPSSSTELLDIEFLLVKEGFEPFANLSYETGLMVLSEDVVWVGTIGSLRVSLSSVPTEEKSANLEVVTEVNLLVDRAETASLLGGS